MPRSRRDEHSRLALFTNYDEAVERLTFASAATGRLIRYRDTVNLLERFPGAARHIAERARDAENDMRVLLKCALDSLNELRDSGAMEGLVNEGAKLLESPDNIVRLFAAAPPALAEKLPGVDLSFLEESKKLIGQLELGVHRSGERIVAKFRLPGGERRSTALSPRARPGQLGRVSATDFFGRAGAVVVLVDPAFADDDCHHQKQTLQIGASQLPDYYAQAVGALAHARDFMATHARVAEHFGRPHITANPVWLLVGIAVLAAICFVAGAVISIGCSAGSWNKTVCDWGHALLTLGAIAFATSNCARSDKCQVYVQGNTVTIVNP